MKRKHYRFALLSFGVSFLILFSSFLLRASFTELNGTRYLITAWTIEDGLPQNSILCMLQSREGYIWLGTQLGLVRFDGIAVYVFNRWNTKELKSDRILSLYEDTEGSLWIGTDGGGVCRIKNNTWACFTTEEGLSNNTVRAIDGDGNGNIWAGTDNGINLLEFGGSKIKTLTLEDGLSGYSVTALKLTRDNTLWIGTNGSGINRLKNNRFLPVIQNKSLNGRIINTIFEETNGKIRVGTDYGTVTIFKDEIISDEQLDALSQYSINAIMEDSTGDIWFGTDGGGVFRLQSKQGILKPLTTQHGLPDNFIYSLMEDYEGNFWVGTYATGVIRLKRVKVKSTNTLNELPEKKINSLFYDDSGYLWAGLHRNGLAQFQIGGSSISLIKIISTNDGLPGDSVRVVYIDNEKNIWLGIEHVGLVEIKNGKYNTFSAKDGISDRNITSILQNSSGEMWVGTSKGLFYGEKKELGMHFQVTELNNHFIRIIIEEKEGSILVGTKQGIFRRKEGEFKKLNLDFDYDVMALYEDSQRNLWIGTNGSGFIRIPKGDISSYSNFTSAHGIPGNYIYSIDEDSNGNFWMGSNHGVFCLLGNELEMFKGSADRGNLLTIDSYDEKDGMPAGECVMGGQTAVKYEPGNTNNWQIFIPTVKGIAIFDTAIRKANDRLPPPPVIIENVIADNKSILNSTFPVTLPSKTSILEFNFTAINFSAPEKVKILYKLDGFDSNWQKTSPQQNRMALYLNLLPGEYHFKVIACSNHGVWNRKGASFSFKIITPVFQRPIFYVLLVIGLIVTGGGIYLFLRILKQSRIKIQEVEKKKEKYKTSALLPETVELVLPQLNKLMDEEKVFLNPDLTLKKLSQQLNVHYNHLSQIINENMGKSFNDYINYYRIEEAKKLLLLKQSKNKTILEIAYDTGFYSKSVFNTAFKKFTGMTPTEYKKAKGKIE